MFDKADVRSWLVGLGDIGKAAFDAEIREDWPADDEEDIQKLISAISIILKEKMIEGNDQVLSNADNSTLLGLMAMFSFPRALRLLNILGNSSLDKLSSITDPALAVDEQSTAHMQLVFLRISYMARTTLIIRIFSKERTTLVLDALLNQSLKTVQKIKTQNEAMTGNSNSTKPTQDANASVNNVEVSDDFEE